MTTERSSFDDAGNVDAIVGTREDEMTSSGLSDAPGRTSSSSTGSGTGTSMSGSTTGNTGSSGSGDRLQEAASGVADRVSSTAQQQVGGALNTQLGRGADMLGQVTGAIRKTGDELRGEQPQVASFADTAADQVDRVAEYLRGTDLQGLMRSAEDFARRQPAVFLGGAFALGILASRFMKASPQDGGNRGGYRGGFDRGYGRYGSNAYGTYGGYRGGGYAGYSGSGRGMSDTSGLGGYGSGAGSSMGAGTGSSMGGGSTAGGTGSDAYGSAQANYTGSDTGPYGGDTGTRYAESGSGAATSDEGAERGGI